ncbi:MAG: SMC-Scp complex subunit ScpB [Planctomycetes bacterium]|nr:SMC-Scp complex subunit ScpB [Planctomycetota bacterium]
MRPTDDFGAKACYKHTIMDEISRELPPDTTTTNGPRELPKGPEELVAFERGQTAENLVVRDRFSLGGSTHGDSAGQLEIGGGEVAMNRIPGSDEAPQPEGRQSPEPAPETPVEPAAQADEPAAGADQPAAEADGGPVELGIAPPDAAVVADEIGAAEAAAAVAAEAEVAAIEEELELPDEEGLPPAPELTDPAEVARVVYVLMLTSREGLSLLRLAQACNTTQKLVAEALELLQQQMRSLGLPVELCKSGDTVKWMSGAEAFVYLQRLRGVKKLEKLSPAALETLAVIAYRQPVMRSEIEAIRGVKAGPMLRTLLQHKLVRCTGRADVPGRPLQYGTTQQFLERFGLGSLQELPSVKEWKNLG